MRTLKGIQSIELGGRLLAALADAGKPMPLGILARQADMSASKARRYLISFVRTGLVEQDAGTQQYELGWFAIRLGLAGMHQRDIVRQARPALRRLASAINETVALVVWMGDGPTVVHFEERVGGLLRVVAQLGQRLPLVNTAAGRLFAAYMPVDVTAPLVERQLKGLDGLPYAPRTPVSRKAFDTLIEEVRKRGLARTVGEASTGVSTMAAPIFAQDGAIQGAVVALGYHAEFDDRWTGSIAAALRQSAREIERGMGFSAPVQAS